MPTSLIKYLLLSLLSVAMHDAFAEDYYWRVTGSSTQFASAADACTFAFETSTYANRPNSGVKTVPSGPTGYRCTAYYNNNLGFYTESLIALASLRGNACPAGKTFQNDDPNLPVCAAQEETSENGQQKGAPDFCATGSASGIDFSVGNKFHKDSDYQHSNSRNLKFERYYNSLDQKWSHTYSTQLDIQQDTNTAKLTMPDGREAYFSISGDSTTSTSGDRGVLSKTSGAWNYLSPQNERSTFDNNGKLVSKTNADGIILTVAHQSNQTTISDPFGNTITYTTDNHSTPLTLSTPATQTSYNYDSSSRLTSATTIYNSETSERLYHYENTQNDKLLTGVTNEAGQRFATWSYDTDGRVITSEGATGSDAISISYNSDHSVSLTNSLGKTTRYQFQIIQSLYRVTAMIGEPSPNCPDSNSTFTYDERGLLKTKTDNKGILTTYDYNERGLEISRTEASGTPQARTITTAWHPEFFLPVMVTEPDRVLHFEYDAQGKQISQTITAL